MVRCLGSFNFYANREGKLFNYTTEIFPQHPKSRQNTDVSRLIPRLCHHFQNGAVRPRCLCRALSSARSRGGSQRPWCRVGHDLANSDLTTEGTQGPSSRYCKVLLQAGCRDCGRRVERTDEGDRPCRARAQGRSAPNAALVLSALLNKLDQAGLEVHFPGHQRCVALPVLLYNVPARTIVDLVPETLARLAQLANIVGSRNGCRGELSPGQPACGR